MRPTVVFAFGGVKRAGKDSSAKYLYEYFLTKGYRCKRFAFATKLKEVSYNLFSHLGLQPGEYYDRFPEAKEKPLIGTHLTPRAIWIGVGQKMREIDDRVWINSIFNDCDVPIAIVTDMRFRSEANFLLEDFNATLSNVIRPGYESEPGEPTENDLNDFKHWSMIFENNLDEKYLGYLIWSSFEDFLNKNEKLRKFMEGTKK